MMNLLAKILMVFCSMQSITVMAATIQEQTWTQKVFKPLIELQCANELKSSKIWQASSFFFSAEQQQKAQQNICGCVSDNALNDVSTKELLLASVNETAKNKLINHAISNSLKGCAQEALK